jgi:hypothetical protein
MCACDDTTRICLICRQEKAIECNEYLCVGCAAKNGIAELLESALCDEVDGADETMNNSETQTAPAIAFGADSGSHGSACDGYTGTEEDRDPSKKRRKVPSRRAVQLVPSRRAVQLMSCKENAWRQLGDMQGQWLDQHGSLYILTRNEKELKMSVETYRRAGTHLKPKELIHVEVHHNTIEGASYRVVWKSSQAGHGYYQMQGRDVETFRWISLTDNFDYIWRRRAKPRR